MAPRGRLLALGATLAVLALPASAFAETFRGETVQGKPVKLQTRPGGEVRKVVWRWRTADCERRDLRLKTQSTVIKNPQGRKPGSFAAKGTYKLRFTDAKVRIKVAATGHQRSRRRWSGSFHAKARVNLDHGPTVTCKLRRIDWAAKLKRA